MATIYDVARIAGVSPKTVSRVLNGDAPVGQATREAVQAAIAQLDYVPSNAARMMRSQRSGLIGLITGAISMSPEPTQPAGLPELFIVQGIQKSLANSGMTLMIADTGGVVEKAAPLIDTFLRHRVEGLIYVAEYHQKVALPLISDGTPMILANCFDDRGTPAILPDDWRGQHDLVARLITAGHRRIGYLSLRPEIAAGRLRLEGYRAALRAFPPMVPEFEYSEGAEVSRQAQSFWRDEWTGKSFMAIGAQDPVLGEPVMQALRYHIRNCPQAMVLPEAGHFVQEHGEVIAKAALKALVSDTL